MKKKLPEVIYYSDPLNDEFSTAVITPRRIDDSYQYIPTGRWKKFTHFFWYRMIAIPLARVYLKGKFSHRMVGKENLVPYQKKGYFLYGNHTQDIADALIPTMISRPDDVYVIVHPNNVSMPVLGKITPSLGALPLPDTMTAARNFLKAISTRVSENKVIAIYPEAHIWPYYTDIRPFGEQSFQYPIRQNKPVFCFTNTYQQEKPKGKIRIVTYIDGPFFPDDTLHGKAQISELRDRVYRKMKERAKESNVQVIRYLKKEMPEQELPEDPEGRKDGTL